MIVGSNPTACYQFIQMSHMTVLKQGPVQTAYNFKNRPHPLKFFLFFSDTDPVYVHLD